MRGQLPTELALLPTPRGSDMNGAGLHGQGGMDLRTAVRLLPTPHGMPKEGQERRPGPTGNELGRALTLLPTPNATLQNYDEDTAQFEARRLELKERHKNGNGIGLPLGVAVRALGSSGATTSPPSGAGNKSPVLRLSPSFVEWMIGAPQGWSDPDCPLSATEFRCRSRTSAGSTSSNSSEGG